jgi:hypothetical protein
MIWPLAWYLTWTTYGTWLHGDSRGSYLGHRPIPPNPELEADMRASLAGDPVYLTDAQRTIVHDALLAECPVEGWIVHAINVRTNHVHIVVSANRDGDKVRSRLKAIASDALSTAAGLPMAGSDGRRRWRTEKGNVVAVEVERGLEESLCAICSKR